MLKPILVALLTILIGTSIFVTLYSAESAEYRNLRDAPLEIGESFTIPVKPVLDDPSVLFPALTHAAMNHKVNLFRTSFGYDKNNQPYITHFILLAMEQTDFFRPFRTKNGRYLSSLETQQGLYFLSSVESDNELQIDTIDDIGQNNIISIYGLREVFDSLPTAGNYIIESDKHTDIEAFYDTLLDNLTQSGVEISRNDLISGGVSQNREMTLDAKPLNWAVIWFLIFIVAILIVYRQLYESKRTAILLLLGNSIIQTWFQVTGKIILFTMVICSIIGVIISSFIPGGTFELITSTAVQLLCVTCVTVSVSLITVPYIYFMKIGEALKNRKDTKMLLLFNIAIKCILTLILIVMGTSSLAQFEIFKEAEHRLGSWKQTSQYGIFYPKSNGADLQELQNGQLASTAAEVYDLYPAVNERGALFVETLSYEPAVLDQMIEGYRSMQVNPNYLLQYPINGMNGLPIHISENDADWILLVPESYRSEEDKIIQFFQTERIGGNGVESVSDIENHLFGRTSINQTDKQKVRIIWTKNNQRVFSFNPKVFPDDGNCIVDPIIKVMTINNSTGIDRVNSFTGGAESGVKIKLKDEDTIKTLQELHDLLTELKLDDNFTHLVTLNDYALAEFQQLQLLLRDTLLQGLVILSLFLLFVVQSVTLLFEQNARRIAVCRLLGHTFISRHRKSVISFLAIWILLVLAETGILMAFREHLNVPSIGVIVSYGIAVVFLLLEALISAATLAFVEKRRISNVLKGEF